MFSAIYRKAQSVHEMTLLIPVPPGLWRPVLNNQKFEFQSAQDLGKQRPWHQVNPSGLADKPAAGAGKWVLQDLFFASLDLHPATFWSKGNPTWFTFPLVLPVPRCGNASREESKCNEK